VRLALKVVMENDVAFVDVNLSLCPVRHHAMRRYEAINMGLNVP
jgi:hypothetical protein